MSVVLSEAIRAARLSVVGDALAGGAVTFFGGARPVFGTTTGLLPQATAPLQDPAFALTGTSLTLIGTVEGLRTDAAAITWARFYDAAGNPVLDCDVSSQAAGSSGDIKLNNVNGAVNGFVQLTAGTFTG